MLHEQALLCLHNVTSICSSLSDKAVPFTHLVLHQAIPWASFIPDCVLGAGGGGESGVKVSPPLAGSWFHFPFRLQKKPICSVEALMGDPGQVLNPPPLLEVLAGKRS